MSSKLSYRDDPESVPACDVVSYELELAVYVEAGRRRERHGFFAETHDLFCSGRFFGSTPGEALETLLRAVQPSFRRARLRVRLVNDPGIITG